MIEALKKIFRLSQWLHHKSNYQSDKWYFILNYGIGDTYLVCSLIDVFSKGCKKVELILTNANHEFIPTLFNLTYSKKNISNLPINLINEFSTFKQGCPIILNPTDLNQGILLSILGYKHVTLIDLYKVLLNLDLSTIPSKPFLNNIANIKTDIVRAIEEINHKEKTIILCPIANSIELIDDNYWILLAKKVKSAGYTPLLMGYQIDGIQTINFPLSESKFICENATCIISLRSGFCELISSYYVKKVILYPHIKWFQGYLIESTSLQSMGLVEDNKRLLELEINKTYDEVDADKLVNDIIKFIDE
jgi:hypothetical protein